MTSEQAGATRVVSIQEQLDELRTIYLDGNPLALHEAIGLCSREAHPTPEWLSDGLRQLFIDFYSGNVFGTKGHGNSVLGHYKKTIKNYVLSEAYRTIRAWQKAPHAYVHMPRRLNELWFEEKVKWRPKGWMDALRFAHLGLQGTAFQARMGTIRKAKSQIFPRSITFGHFEAEVALGLRGEEGIFGPPKEEPPLHIQMLLDEHP